MRWLCLFVLGPMIWAVTFSAVYGLHGMFCAVLTGPEQVGPEALGTGARVVMVAVWLAGLAALGGLFWVFPSTKGQAQQMANPRIVLLHASALIGLGATFFTLFPVVVATSC